VVDEAITTGSVYVVKAVHSGKCLDITGNSTASGAAVEQWDCNGQKNQQFKFIDVGSGWWEVRPQNSGTQCVDVYQASLVNGGVIDQWSCNTHSSQHWKLVSLGSGKYQLQAPEQRQVHERDRRSLVRGAKMQQWTCSTRPPASSSPSPASRAAAHRRHRHRRQHRHGGSTSTGAARHRGSSGGGAGNFPARVSRPTCRSGTTPTWSTCPNGTGNKFWTLAFIINGGGTCNPKWNGDTTLTGNNYGTYINNLRGIGGDVIVSFGGASAPRSPSRAPTSPAPRPPTRR
jgi:hypothetical protein